MVNTAIMAVAPAGGCVVLVNNITTMAKAVARVGTSKAFYTPLKAQSQSLFLKEAPIKVINSSVLEEVVT